MGVFNDGALVVEDRPSMLGVPLPHREPASDPALTMQRVREQVRVVWDLLHEDIADGPSVAHALVNGGPGVSPGQFVQNELPAVAGA